LADDHIARCRVWAVHLAHLPHFAGARAEYSKHRKGNAAAKAPPVDSPPALHPFARPVCCAPTV
jgi:hypothetical protein